MSPSADELLAGYAETLRERLAAGGEASLQRAYELGRAAIGAGLGVVQLLLAHQSALNAALAESASVEQSARITAGAGELLMESLSPFEMTFRGYEEANQALRALNLDLRRAKETADAAKRELEAFSYSVAHDLRAPLRSIDGFSQALFEECGDGLGEQARDHLARVRGAAQKMGELIDDLLSLSQVARVELRRERVDLSALAMSIGAELRKTQPERRVDLQVGTGLWAEGDARLLEVALSNLLGNAWKFTSKKVRARIEVGVLDQGHEKAFFIRDDGAGFDSAFAGNLFAPFRRLHSSEEFEGTGIGLATVRRIVHRHGGRVWAEGAVEKGATFYFTLS